MKQRLKGLNYEKYYKELLPYFKKQKNQQYLAVVLTMSATIFFALFAINPTLSTISKLKKEIADSRFVEEKLSSKINSLSTLSTQYQVIQKSMPLIHDAIPLEPEVPVLVARIQSIAESSEVSTEDVKIFPLDLSANHSSTQSSSFVFEVTGTGTYENIKKFMSGLLNMQRVISIESISLSKDLENSQNVEITLKGTAYYKKQ